MASQRLDDVYVGTLSCGSFSPPASCIDADAIEPNAGIEASKVEHRHMPVLGQKNGAANVAMRQVIHILYGTTGTLLEVRARNITIAGTGTTSIQIKKNGSNILSSALTLAVGDGTTLKTTSSFTSAALVAGDLLEVDITVSDTDAGQGVSVGLVLDEDAN